MHEKWGPSGFSGFETKMIVKSNAIIFFSHLWVSLDLPVNQHSHGRRKVHERILAILAGQPGLNGRLHVNRICEIRIK